MRVSNRYSALSLVARYSTSTRSPRRISSLDTRPLPLNAVDGHLGAAAAVGPHPRDAALVQRARPRIWSSQAHPLDHVAAGAPQVDGLSARPDSVGEFDDVTR